MERMNLEIKKSGREFWPRMEHGINTEKEGAKMGLGGSPALPVGGDGIRNGGAEDGAQRELRPTSGHGRNTERRSRRWGSAGASPYR